MKNRAEIPAGHLTAQRDHFLWSRCFMPSWFLNVADAPVYSGLKEKYCKKGVGSVLKYVHASCIPMYRSMAIALKEQYSRQMTEFLDGAWPWMLARVDEYVAQISSTVAEDANNGGYPKLADWKAAIDGTKAQITEVIVMGTKLANATCGASLCESDAEVSSLVRKPTADASACFKLPEVDEVTAAACKSGKFFWTEVGIDYASNNYPTFYLDIGSSCNGGYLWSMCKDPRYLSKGDDCVLRKQKEGTGNHKKMLLDMEAEALACVTGNCKRVYICITITKKNNKCDMDQFSTILTTVSL